MSHDSCAALTAFAKHQSCAARPTSFENTTGGGKGAACHVHQALTTAKRSLQGNSSVHQNSGATSASMLHSIHCNCLPASLLGIRQCNLLFDISCQPLFSQSNGKVPPPPGGTACTTARPPGTTRQNFELDRPSEYPPWTSSVVPRRIAYLSAHLCSFDSAYSLWRMRRLYHSRRCVPTSPCSSSTWPTHRLMSMATPCSKERHSWQVLQARFQ